MKAYLKYIGIRVLLAMLFMACMYLLNGVIYKNSHSKLFAGVKDIIVGDSHFNGLSIKQVMHLGQDSEVYYTMYQKIKEANEISKLDNVVISYSYLNFSKGYFDDFLLSNDVQAYSISARNYPLASLKDQIGQSKYLSQLLKVLARFNFSLNLNYLQDQEELKKNLPFMWDQSGLDQEVDLEFLKKLQKRRKHKIDPNSRRYKNQIAAKIERLFINEKEEVADDPEFFQDEHHVAVYGAALLSQDIENAIRASR